MFFTIAAITAKTINRKNQMKELGYYAQLDSSQITKESLEEMVGLYNSITDHRFTGPGPNEMFEIRQLLKGSWYAANNSKNLTASEKKIYLQWLLSHGVNLYGEEKNIICNNPQESYFSNSANRTLEQQQTHNTGMIYCPDCGKNLASLQARFCPYCGKALQ